MKDYPYINFFKEYFTEPIFPRLHKGHSYCCIFDLDAYFKAEEQAKITKPIVENKSIMENKDLIGNIPIGKTFQYKSKKIKVVKYVGEGIACNKCIFEICPQQVCKGIACCPYQRDDGKNVYFELVK